MFVAQPISSVITWGFAPVVLALASTLYMMLVRGPLTFGGLAASLFAGASLGLVGASGLWIGLCFSHRVPKKDMRQFYRFAP